MEILRGAGPILALQRVVGKPLRVQREPAVARVFHGGEDPSVQSASPIVE